MLRFNILTVVKIEKRLTPSLITFSLIINTRILLNTQVRHAEIINRSLEQMFMFLCSSTQRTTILRPFVRRTAVNVIGVYAPWIHFRSVKSERVFEMILSFSIREIENGGEEDATRCVQTICMSCKQDLAQLCGLRVVGLICSVRCKVYRVSCENG